MAKRIAIDIFSGAGGLSIGAKWAGIKPVLAIELDKFSADTYRKNHPETKVLQEDIKNINPLDYINEEPFILFGGPPCQGFSYANTKTRNNENLNNSLFKEYLHFVEKLKPEWFLFENVKGFKTFNNGTFALNVEEKLKNIGYETSSAILCASDYGVPQKRLRFFIIGHRKDKGGIRFDFNQIDKKEMITVGDAISDLPILKNGDKKEYENYKNEIKNVFVSLMRNNSSQATQNFVSKSKDYVIERYKNIKAGQNWEAIKHQLLNYKSTHNIHSGIYRRLDPNEPACTIANYRKSMLIHPQQDRGLSLREAARLQSFPDTYQFCGNISNMQQQVGNAVPPLLAKAIFEQIIKLNDSSI
ncbi:MAG: DNA cytosine methyltransferase [Methylococcaceae bacterium]